MNEHETEQYQLISWQDTYDKDKCENDWEEHWQKICYDQIKGKYVWKTEPTIEEKIRENPQNYRKSQVMSELV